MAIHNYGAESPIGRVTLRRCSTGAVRAYLHAGEQATPDQLNDLLRPIREQRTMVDKERNWQFIPTEIDGKPVLEVRGFGHEANLFASIRKHGLTAGKMQGITPEPEDKVSRGDWLRSQALKFSGFLYFTGDIAFGLYGMLGKNKDGKSKSEVVVASAFYALGSMMLTFFARDNATQRLRDVSGMLSTELGKHGVVADSSTAAGQIHDDSRTRPLDSVGNFMRKYHAEGMNLGFAVSGAAQIVGSTKNLMAIQSSQGKGLTPADEHYIAPGEVGFHRTNALMDLGVGIMTSASSLATIATPEKSLQEKAQLRAEAKGPVGKVVNWFREKPMRISGYGLSSSTVLHFFSSLRNLQYSNNYLKDASKFEGRPPSFRADLEREKKSFTFRMIFVVANLLAEGVMTLGHKGHGEGIENDDGVTKSACALAAELIAREPALKRPHLIQAAAATLASPNALGGRAEDYVPLLEKQLAAQTAHPWRAPNAAPMRISNIDRAPATRVLAQPPIQPIVRTPNGTEASLESLLALAEAGPALDKAERGLRAEGKQAQADALMKLQQDAGVAVDRAFQDTQIHPEGTQARVLSDAFEPVTPDRLAIAQQWVRGAEPDDKEHSSPTNPAASRQGKPIAPEHLQRTPLAPRNARYSDQHALEKEQAYLAEPARM